ncbi:MAG TPA: sugar ABC transporter permease [Ramlibacter sp.]
MTARHHAEGAPGLSPAPGLPSRRSARPWYHVNEKTRFTLLLLAPSATLLVLFQIMPIIIGANASFRDWRLYDPQKTWVGLQHYIYILTDPVFLTLVLPNTLLLMVLSVSIGLCLGLALAHLMNQHFVGHTVIQTIILLPLMIAPVIASMMMRWIFNDQFGVVAAVMEALGLGSIAWLSDRWPSFAIIVLTDVWLWTPWFTIILLAGLRSLPKEPYEAAAIDAAGKWRVFTHITLPMMRSVMAVCIVIRSIDAFRTFDQVWVITGGGPARQTEVFSIYAYTEAFVFLNFARGTAAAIIGAMIIGTLGWGLYKMLNRFMEVSR